MHTTLNTDELREQRDSANLAVARAARSRTMTEDEHTELRRTFAHARARLALVEALHGYPRLTDEQRADLNSILEVI